MASNNTKKLKILQWNCRSIIPKIDRLKALISVYNLDIICLNETWLIETKYFRIPSFNMVRKDRNNSFGGVLVGVREGIEFKYLNFSIHTQIEYLVVSITQNNFNFNIVCLYIPPNISFSVADIRNILDNVPSPFLFWVILMLIILLGEVIKLMDEVLW